MTHTETPLWLVYSREHNAWWRSKAAGYSTLIENAGRYTKAEAEIHCGSRDFADKDNPPEVACIAPEAIGYVNAFHGLDIPTDRIEQGCVKELVEATEKLLACDFDPACAQQVVNAVVAVGKFKP